MSDYTRADYDRDVHALLGLDTGEGGVALGAGAISEEALVEGYVEMGQLLRRIRAFEKSQQLEATLWHYDGSALKIQLDPLSFAELRVTNVQRCEAAFHPLDTWNPAEWSNAMAGEVGEACNITKKMLRGDYPDQYAIRELGKELADVVIYADLLAAREDTVRVTIRNVGPLTEQDLVRLACGPDRSYGDERDEFYFNWYGMVLCPKKPTE